MLRIILLAFVLSSSIVMANSLNQAAYKYGSESYVYAYNSIPNMAITGAPVDTDWSRWAMLHDGSAYRLYFFKMDSNDTFYQFSFNRASNSYEFGYNSIPVLKLTGIPADADASSFAMLHDGSAYRLYLRKKGDPSILYQFAFNRASNNYEFGYNSIPAIPVAGMPLNTDYMRWAMLHDGQDYRIYFMAKNSNTVFYQGAFNRATNKYEYAYRSIPQLTVEDMPNNINKNDFGMLHDGRDYRFYYLSY